MTIVEQLKNLENVVDKLEYYGKMPNTLQELDEIEQAISKVMSSLDTKIYDIKEVARLKRKRIYNDIKPFLNRKVVGRRVEINGELVPISDSRYGGNLIIPFDLPVGTKFKVTAGHWDGKIVEVDGKKKLDTGIEVVDLDDGESNHYIYGYIEE